MNKKILSMAFVTGTLAFAANSQASFLVDGFGDDSAFITATGSDITSPLNDSDFSDSRELSIAENPAGAGGATVIAFAGELGISTGFQTGSDVTSSYNNAGGFNFTEPEAGATPFTDTFVLSLLSIDQGGVDITLTIDGISATQSVNTPGDVLFAHSLFGDLSSVNDIEFFVHNNIAVDATFDSLASFSNIDVPPPPPPAVPEPTSLALLGIGLAAFGFGRRKAK